MKKFKIYLSFLAVFALLFTSCSKEENSGMNDDSGKATLSFGAIVQDLAANSNNKQSDIGEFPECSADDPAYVEIVLMQGGNAVVGSMADPYRVDLVAGQIFTEEDAALELEPGNYSLDHFSVYNAEGDLIWLAPKGGIFADFVDNPLPLSIDLGAGVKKYVDVSVLCYDDRDVNQYGYLFFELDTNEAFEFCFFANYCTPEGRHFPARYSVDISIDGTSLYTGVVNNTGRNNDGDLFADPLCFALPNLEAYADNEEYIDYTLTLLDWTEMEDAYGDVDQMVISGSLSRAEIMANFDGDDDVEYEHFRFGCDDDGGNGGPVDSDGDGVLDNEDDCPNEAGPVENNGCPETGDTDADGDGILDTVDQCPDTPSGVSVDAVGCPVDTDNDTVPDYIDNCPNTANPDQADSDSDGTGDVCEDVIVETCELDPLADETCTTAWIEGTDGFVAVPGNFPFDVTVDGNRIGEATVEVVGGNVKVLSVLSPTSGYLYTAYEIWISSSQSTDDLIVAACANVTPEGTLEVDFGSLNLNYGEFYVRMKTYVCPDN